MLGHWYIQLLAGAAPAAPAAAVGVPGGWRGRYVVYIDGEPYFGELAEVQAKLEEMARQEAQQVIAKAKEPRKPVITVKAGRELPKPIEFKPIQAQVRRIYQTAYDDAFHFLMQAKLVEMAREIDEEEAMLLL